MRYDYKCENHGVIEVCHGMKESRSGRLCPECNSNLKPLISAGASILFTGRPPWAYNDIKSYAKLDETEGVNIKNATISDKRDGSRTKGQKIKINNQMGDYNAQW